MLILEQFLHSGWTGTPSCWPETWTSWSADPIENG